MKKVLLILVCITLTINCFADHIIGGEMYYTLKGTSGNQNTYTITLKLFMRCDATDLQIDASSHITIFNKANGMVKNLQNIPRLRTEEFYITESDPCIVNPPSVCYLAAYYTTDVTLPNTASGYTAVYQRCCRASNLMNIQSSGSSIGATYSVTIPGNASGLLDNSSPHFAVEKGVVICANKHFAYEMTATDPDQDQIEYSFGNAYSGATDLDPAPTTASTPPFQAVTYKPGFSASHPLGPDVTIDPQTGVISGLAPAAGLYIVTVVAREIREGVVLSEHHKEVQLTVQNCVRLVKAATQQYYNSCQGLTISFNNESTPNKVYQWDMGTGEASGKITTNSREPLEFTFPQPGTYEVTLTVDPESNCGDSMKATVVAYPILQTDFEIVNPCVGSATTFNNTSTTTFGNITETKWDFGLPQTLSDTARTRNSLFTYAQNGMYDVTLTIRTDLGCEHQITRSVAILAPPSLFTTQDTVVCLNNSISLRAESNRNGTYSWDPAPSLQMGQTPNPLITPLQNTSYQVHFTDMFGCTNSKRIAVEVVSNLDISAPPSQIICTGDTLLFQANGHPQFAYQWIDLQDGTVLSEDRIFSRALQSSSDYQLEARLGTCSASERFRIETVDPPVVTLTDDATICHGVTMQLEASGGSIYRWEPNPFLQQLNTPVQLTTPLESTTYRVWVSDVLGCPKEVPAEVHLTVIPPVPAFAGNDTIVLKGEPFQLQASGGSFYQWTPQTGLNFPNISNPLTTIQEDTRYHVQVTTEEGCVGFADIFVRFMYGPKFHVPNAFSPNGDGVNDVFRPLPVGIVELGFLRIFDRWGKEVFRTNAYLEGWDGKIKGKLAEVGTYVWMVEGKSRDGEFIRKSGHVTLIR